MGGFINSQADSEICEVLNKRFKDEEDPYDSYKRTYIKELRDLFAVEDLFDSDHHLNRVFHRLAISVSDGGKSVPSNQKSRWRWLYFLRKKMPQPTKDAIISVLSTILNINSNIAYATFSTSHTETKTKTFELYPDNTGYPDLYVDANNRIYCHLTLLCHEDKPLPDNDTEKDPPDKDKGEKSLLRRTKRKSAKKASKKSSAKKSRKKGAAKKRKAKK